jgi:hypothetical protein
MKREKRFYLAGTRSITDLAEIAKESRCEKIPFFNRLPIVLEQLPSCNSRCGVLEEEGTQSARLPGTQLA